MIKTGYDQAANAGFGVHTYRRYLNRWIHLIIRPLLPEDAKVEAGNHYDDLCISMDCGLPAHPGSDSGTVNLVIERQALDDYILEYNPALRFMADIRLKQFIQKKLGLLQPVSGSPSRQEDFWVLTSRILNGAA